MKNNEDERSIYHNLILLALLMTVLFLFLAVWTGLKINDNQYCAITRFYDGDNTGEVNSTFILNDTSKAVLQEFTLDKEYLKYMFCFDVNSSTSNILSIVNMNNETLGKVFVNNASSHYCSYLDDDYVERLMQLGLRCDTCGTNEVTILKEVIGTDVTQIKTDFSNYVVTYSSDPLNYRLFGYENCKVQLKYLTGWYLVVLLLEVFITILVYGFAKFKEFVLDVGGEN